MLRWSSGYLARPSTWRLPVRPWHGALKAPSSLRFNSHRPATGRGLAARQDRQRDGKARHLDLAWSNQAGRRTVNAYGEGSNPSARATGLWLRRWSCRGDGVPATRQGGDRGFEPRQDRRHARIAQRQSARTTTRTGPFGLKQRVPSAHRLKDQGTRLRISRWGFDSSWARSSSASSIGESARSHTRSWTEVRLLPEEHGCRIGRGDAAGAGIRSRAEARWQPSALTLWRIRRAGPAASDGSLRS